MKVNHSRLLLISILSLTVNICSHPANPGKIVVREINFEMKVPSGWKAGCPSVQSRRKFKPAVNGDYCFRCERNAYPFGRVWVMKLAPFSTLEELVNSIPSLHGMALDQTRIQVCGYDAIQVHSAGLGENRQPVKGIYRYILKGDSVIIVSFLTIADSFAQQESLFLSALNTIEIK